MREKLFNQMKQKVDDEDERIAKAVAEQERDRIVSLKLCKCFHMSVNLLY